MINEPQDKNNYYYINSSWLPRVTAVLKIISKGDAFDRWLMNKGNEAKTLVSDAGDIGTSLHNRLEEIGKGIPINKEALKDRERKWVEVFEEWQEQNIDKFLETEMTVYNEEYAGTLDALVRLKDGRIALLDYKTSKYIYDTYELQVVAYLKAYEKMKGVRIDTAIILRFDKESKTKLFEVKEVKDIDSQYLIWQCALKLWQWKYHKYQEVTK